MRNVAAGTLIAVRISASGRILVSLVGLKQIRQPQPESKPLFRGSTEEKLSFRVSAPEADDYVLVLSNRGGSQDVSVQAEIQAVRRAPRRPPNDRAPRQEKAQLPGAYFFATSVKRRFSDSGSTGFVR